MTLFNNFCAAILTVASSCGTAINDAARIIFGFFAAGTNTAVGFLPTIRRMKSATAFLAVAVAIPLMSACGGGGGSSGFTRSNPRIDPALIAEATATGDDAANSRPRSGSVVQSSNRDEDDVNRTTTDTVSVAVNSGADTFRITKGVTSGASGLTFDVSDTDTFLTECTSDCPFDNWFANIRHDADRDGTADGDLIVDFFVADLAPDPINGVSAQHGPTCGVSESVSVGQTCRYEGGEIDPFTFTVDNRGFGCFGSTSCDSSGLRDSRFQASADISDTNVTTWIIQVLARGVMEIHDAAPQPQPQPQPQPTTPRLPAEWLAGGIWWYLPDDVSGIGDIEFGAFVDGQDPFDASSLTRLNGSATYSAVGGAAGIRIEQFSPTDADETLGDTEYFTADVEITANFDTNMISGTINNFDFDDSDARRTLTLMPADIPIDGTSDGFFDGMVMDVAVEADADREGSGRWGGQFFVDGDAATDLPGTVGGTFGFSEDNPRPGTVTEAIIGFFGARRP